MWIKEEWWARLGGGTTVHVVEPEMTTGVQDSIISVLFLFSHLNTHSCTVKKKRFSEHCRLMKDQHVTSAFFFLLPKGLILPFFVFNVCMLSMKGHANVKSKQ